MLFLPLQLRRFLLAASLPTSDVRVAPAAAFAGAAAPSLVAHGASSRPPAPEGPTTPAAGAPTGAAAAATACSRRSTAPTVLSPVHEPLSVAAASADEEALEEGVEKAGAGGGWEVREIPSLRPELKVCMVWYHIMRQVTLD